MPDQPVPAMVATARQLLERGVLSPTAFAQLMQKIGWPNEGQLMASPPPGPPGGGGPALSPGAGQAPLGSAPGGAAPPGGPAGPGAMPVLPGPGVGRPRTPPSYEE